jgi:hypothetical protein
MRVLHFFVMSRIENKMWLNTQVFNDVTPCNWAEFPTFWRSSVFVFRVTQTKQEGLLDPDDETNAIVQNIQEPSPNNSLSHHRRLESSGTTPWETQILQGDCFTATSHHSAAHAIHFDFCLPQTIKLVAASTNQQLLQYCSNKLLNSFSEWTSVVYQVTTTVTNWTGVVTAV